MSKLWIKFIESPFLIIVIALLMTFSIFIYPFIIGLVLVMVKFSHDMKIRDTKFSLENLKTEYETQLEKQNKELKDRYTKQKEEYSSQIYKHKQEQEQKLVMENELLQKEVEQLKIDKKDLQTEISLMDFTTKLASYSYVEYDALSSEECRNQLALLKTKEQDLLKNEKGILFKNVMDKISRAAKNDIKQLLRCFNAECDNILLNLTVKSIDASRNKMQKSFETLNKVFESDGIELSYELFSNRLEQLNLVYAYELKRDEEIATQRAIRDQMIEEDKVRREIERQKAKLEKEEAQFRAEISKLMSYMQKATSEIDKQLYADKIKELDEKVTILEKDKEDVLNREQNTRAGFVYVISNIGAFGEDTYKIGMTRRLEPMDRIKELSDASVPFPFDVHAMIFSDDAPTLETTLHQHFRNQGFELNKVNSRKEFFKVNLKDVEKLVKENHNATVIFTEIPLATEYRRSLEIALQYNTDDEIAG